jgi:hypothetical protein
MNITQLRETITELLGGHPNLIGTYTLPNASQIPAIYVVGVQSVPAEWKAFGMEVSIRQFPERLPTPMVGTVKVTQLWEVILTQYTTAESKVSDAIDRIVRRFPDATLRYFPGDDIAYERCRVIIKDTEIKQLYPRY